MRTSLARRTLVLVAVSLCGCSSDDEGRGALKEGSALTSRVQGIRVGLGPPAGSVVLYNADIVRATEPVELLSVRPRSVPPGMDYLTARAEFLSRSGPGPTTEKLPGNVCAERWPPDGYGPTEAISGLKLQSGDRVAIHFYLHTDGKPSETRGLVITYRTEDGDELQQTLDGVTLSIEPAEASITVCSDRHEWFQGAAGSEGA